MKRKVGNAGKLRLSPNEEAFILKEDYERRRKLRLLQVREQERGIAFQIREDIKQRRSQQVTRLAEELRAEWEEAQSQKIQNLEKLYLASLRHMGEGHRQAKENEPDLDAVARRAAERKRRAEMRHKEALKVQRNQKEMLMRQKTRHIKARKDALLVERERSAKMTRLPPPVPAPFENIDVNRISSLKTNSSTYHHISMLVSRQTDTKQPDAHSAAEETARRLEELGRQAAQQRLEQLEKAHVRGSQAMRKIHLAQNQERLMEELKQLQKEDLARRRQTVAQRPPQVVELPHKRGEMKEDWQRELEFAFEDMYGADRKVRGDLILHLEPEPLPSVTMTEQLQDEELDLSMEQEPEKPQAPAVGIRCSSETDVPAMKTQKIPSRIIFKKLLNKIRSQKSLWTIKSVSEEEMKTAVSEAESEATALGSGTSASEEGTLSSKREQVVDSDVLTIESGTTYSSEVKPFPCPAGSGKEQAVTASPPATPVLPNSILLHPQEEAVRVRMSARHRQIMEIEEQKRKQLELLEQIEQQKLRLETDCFRAQLEEEKRRKTRQTEGDAVPAWCAVVSDEDCHKRMIRSYQQQLLQQNRLHKQSVETARKRLLEFQTLLKERYPSMSDSVISVPQQKSKILTPVSDHWNQTQRLKLSLSKHQPTLPKQSPKLDQGPVQASRQDHFPQGEALGTSDVLAKEPLESQEHLQQLSGVETQHRDSQLIPEDSDLLSRTSYDRAQMLQDARKVSEALRATAFQTSDPQQVSSKDTENMSSKPAETSSFLPLVPERSFVSLPVRAESAKVQEPCSAINRSTVSVSQSVINQVHDQPVPSEIIRAQQGHLKMLQEQLELQKDVLQARQEAQKDLEKQAGLPGPLPGAAGDLFGLLPSAKAESQRIQESFLTKSDAIVNLGSMDRLWGLSQPIPSQQNNLEFLQEQAHIERDSLQARREAREVWFSHKQSEPDRSVFSEQAVPSPRHQGAQHPFASLPFADRQSRENLEQPLPTSEKGLLSSQSEVSRPQDGPSSFLQQFLPLQHNLKLLQDQLITQRNIFQARHGAQMELLLHRQRDLRGSRSRPVVSPFSPPAVAQHSAAPQPLPGAEPLRFQRLCSSEENAVLSGDLTIPALQNQSLGFPQHSLPRQDNLTALQEQSHIQRVILGARKEPQELVHKQSELEKGIFSQQTDTSSSPSQAAEWERFQEFMVVKSDNSCPSSPSKTPRSQERLFRFSQHVLPLQDNLLEHQKCVYKEKDAFQFTPKTQENSSSQQTGCSSLTPSLAQPSPVPLPSSDSGTTLEPLLTESNDKVTSRHFQIPELQERLLKISQLIQPQQDNLKALQEKLTTQREAIIQSRPEAHEGSLGHKQRGQTGRVSPERIGASSPLLAQQLSTSLPVSESEGAQELCSATSDFTISSSHSEMLALPERGLGLSHTALPQQGNLIVLPDHLFAQTNSFPSTGRAPKESVLPRPPAFEEEVSAEHFIQLHGDLKTLQQQLDMQRKAIRSDQEIQEELLLRRLRKMEQRVSSEEIGTASFSPQEALPVAHSEGSVTSVPTRGDDTEFSTSHGKLPSFSQLLPQRDNLMMQLDLETVFPKELLLRRQSELNKGASAEHAPTLFLPSGAGHAFIPLPFAEAKSKSICELYLSKNECATPSSDSEISRLPGRLLSYSLPTLTQQDNSGLQKQLNLQREVLHSRQKAQEDLLIQRQTTLQQQIQKHQETLKDFFNDSQTRRSTIESDSKLQKMEQLREWLPHVPSLAWHDEESTSHAERHSSDGNQPLSAAIIGEHSGGDLDGELGRRASKPPRSKVKCGVDLNQHELSTIQEVESPTSGRASTPGKTDFYQDRDPLRVSISREQSFLGSPLACHPSSCHHPATQEDTRLLPERTDLLPEETGPEREPTTSHTLAKVKDSNIEDHEVLSHAVSEENTYTYLGAIMKPGDKDEIQEILQEPLSSITVSTGSFLSYENTDLSLTDSESFSEQVDHQAQESTSCRQEEADPLSSAAPSTHVTQQQQNSSDAHGSLLPPVEGSASDCTHLEQTTVDLDFLELEHLFPNLHRQLFKPLEPHLDFDLSSSSGISQDNRDIYQQSSGSSEKHRAGASSASTVSFTAPRTSLHSIFNTEPNQEPNINPLIGDQSFVTENTDGSEQSFQQLLPELSSQDSQHADLPSIYSIEARGSSRGMEDHKNPEILHSKKKSVHFQLSMENLSSACSSPGDNQLGGRHSTPCSSVSSGCSGKQENRERLGFQGQSSKKVVTVSPSQRCPEDDCTACSSLGLNPGAEELGASLQPPHSLSTQSEWSFQNSTLKALRNLPHLTQPDPVACSQSSLRSSIPVWETESGLGIMEEAEPTLVSISDVSATEADFANLTLEERESEAKGYFQAGEFLPLPLETSDCPAVSELSTVETPTAPPSSLQEAFAKRKKSFMERSYQRLREIRSKARLSHMSKEKTSAGSSLSRLKGVNKVRVSLPEERRTAQALMHQRALRLYSQLAEVKQQREERAKQDVHTHSRAKEFPEKALEKPEAKNTC